MVSRATFEFLSGLKSWRARSFYILSEIGARLGFSHETLRPIRHQVYGRFDGVLGKYELRPGTLDAWGVHQGNEAETHARIEELFPEPGGVMLDVGGYIGYFSLRYCSRFQKIYVFEPFTDNANMIEKNISLNNSEAIVNLVRMGVSDAAGTRSMFLQHNDTHSLVQGDKADSIKIRTVTLDGFVIDNGIDASLIRFIKIDVEGAELSVLKGSVNLLKAARPIIVAESNTNEEQSSIEAFLNTIGYQAAGHTDGRNFWYVPA